MRVAIVGGTGNVGSAILDALADTPEVTSVLGLARRLPDKDAHPYSTASWATVDIGAQPDASVSGPGRDVVVDRLAGLFDGVDAVIHLVHAIQPNHDRALLRRVNVGGTVRVAKAVVRAGVRHLVMASSWAVYSPVDDDVPRDESAPRDGIPSSHYSVDKRDQERVLDALEAAHPEITVTRMRTGLVFSEPAGAQVVRLFLGPYVPLRLLVPGTLPFLPLPTGARAHVVHAEDVGRAYALAVARRVGGAFNIAADDVLWPADLARVVDGGRYVEISPRVVRPLLHAAWRARLSASDAGWLDMAMGVPLMDGTRARTELGWHPRRGAEETLREMLLGMVERRGRASIPMRPRDTRWHDTAPPA